MPTNPTLPTLALMTDFGNKDGFAGILKGIVYRTIQAGEHLPSMLALPPVVDITHEIEPFNVRQAAWILNNCHVDFPENTVFVCVVDPGVGSESQNKLLLHWKERRQYFIGPDNGLFTPIIENAARQDETLRIYRINNPALYRQASIPQAAGRLSNVSQTFHGRDIYGPVAGHLASAIMGFMAEEFLQTVGERVEQAMLLELHHPVRDGGHINGQIVHQDIFGNLITNIPNQWLTEGIENLEIRVQSDGALLGHRWEGQLLRSYADGKDMDRVFVVPSSSGNIELALYQRNAGHALQAKPGDPVELVIPGA